MSSWHAFLWSSSRFCIQRCLITCYPSNAVALGIVSLSNFASSIYLWMAPFYRLSPPPPTHAQTAQKERAILVNDSCRSVYRSSTIDFSVYYFSLCVHKGSERYLLGLRNIIDQFQSIGDPKCVIVSYNAGKSQPTSVNILPCQHLFSPVISNRHVTHFPALLLFLLADRNQIGHQSS